MPLTEIMQAVKTLEEQVVVEYHGDTITPDVYLVVPSGNTVNVLTPAVFTNYPERVEELRMGDTREDNYSIKVRLTTYEPDYDKACEIALMFFDATWKAFDAERPASRRMDGAFNGQMNLRAEEPLLGRFGEGRPGFEIFLDIQNFEDVS